MIRKKKIESQDPIWISTQEIKIKPRYSFYSKLNTVLDKIGFGKKMRKLCNHIIQVKAMFDHRLIQKFISK
jgi:hypothetical protein